VNMTEIQAQSQTVMARCSLRSGIILLGCVSAGWAMVSGCSFRRKPAISWSTAIQVRPVPQQQAAAAGDVSEDPLPEWRIELPPFSPRLLSLRNAPPPPRGSAPPSANAGSNGEKLETPMITPRLSSEEAAAARQETNQSLNIAERNLESVRGRSLNAAQADLVSKIKSFIKDAREAAQVGDWTRARSLAKKAQVLSEELAGSLSSGLSSGFSNVVVGSAKGRR
jgi:hypothetical protein